jgi:hypothetical protein
MFTAVILQEAAARDLFFFTAREAARWATRRRGTRSAEFKTPRHTRHRQRPVNYHHYHRLASSHSRPQLLYFQRDQQYSPAKSLYFIGYHLLTHGCISTCQASIASQSPKEQWLVELHHQCYESDSGRKAMGEPLLLRSNRKTSFTIQRTLNRWSKAISEQLLSWTKRYLGTMMVTLLCS